MNGLLGNAILEQVGIDPAEGNLLLLHLTCHAKLVVSKAATIAVVVLDLHAVLGSEAFKSKLGIKCLQQGKIAHHQIDKLEMRVVVNKDGHITVASLGECTLCLAIETWLDNCMWSTEMHSPSLVAAKMELPSLLLALVCQGTFIMAPKRQPAQQGQGG